MKQRVSRHVKVGCVVWIMLVQLLLSTSSWADDRAKRPFIVTAVPEADLQIYVPARPEWQWQIQQRRDTQAIILSTPENYYPPASIDITSIREARVKKALMPLVARSALKTVREKSAATVVQKIHKTTYGDIVGYQEQLKLSSNGKVFSALSFSGMFTSGRPVSVFVVTQEGQLADIQPMLDKIISHIKPLSAAQTQE